MILNELKSENMVVVMLIMTVEMLYFFKTFLCFGIHVKVNVD